MKCSKCGFAGLRREDRFCQVCGARLEEIRETVAEVTVAQTIKGDHGGSVTGVQVEEFHGTLVNYVLQLNVPAKAAKLLPQLQAIPTEMQPSQKAGDSGKGQVASQSEATKEFIRAILEASDKAGHTGAVRMGEVEVSRVDLLVKQAVLIKTEADQMMLDMVGKNKDVVDRARARSSGGMFQIDLNEMMRGFDSQAYTAKLKEANSLLQEANRLDPANTDVLLHIAQVLDQLEQGDHSEQQKIIYRLQSLLANPKDDLERFRLAQANYLMATTGNYTNPNLLADARAMFEKLGRTEWVRQCDFMLQSVQTTQAVSQAPPAMAPQTGFSPAGQWQIQASDGRALWCDLYPNGTFQAVQPTPFGITAQAAGQWGFNPYNRILQFQGLLNGFQPFVLGISITGQQNRGFYGVGTDGLTYIFQPRFS